MKQYYPILFLSFMAFGNLIAQTHYVDEVCEQVNIQTDVPYAENISILTGTPDTVTLTMDIYTPADDVCTDRPLILFFHTGTFLPQYLNGQITGGKRDSAVVEICKRFARKGYVMASVDYRLGWNPVAEEQDIRTGTLLQAAYRGVLDAKACSRFFRKSVAERGNPYGIDVNKMVAWGQGTGGYITLGQYLDDYAELEVDKFIDSRTLLNYIDTNLLGNVFGNTAKPLNIPNHIEYPSDFAFIINMGGAMGDIGWIDGDPDKEPPVVCFHPSTDPFAPYLEGAVINPRTNQFVVNVSGGRQIIRKANATGINAPMQMANDDASDPLNQQIAAYNVIPFNDTISLAEDNYYPFLFSGVQSGPWEWWGFEQLEQEINFINTNLGTNYNAVELDLTGKATNPDVSKEKALRYIDTLDNYLTPRLFYGLDLSANTCSKPSTVNVLSPQQLDLSIYPNPAQSIITLEVAPDYEILDFGIYDLSGRHVGGALNVNTNRYNYLTSFLEDGLYIIHMRFEEGILSSRILISRK